jgi:hypothetical protein
MDGRRRVSGDDGGGTMVRNKRNAGHDKPYNSAILWTKRDTFETVV